MATLVFHPAITRRSSDPEAGTPAPARNDATGLRQQLPFPATRRLTNPVNRRPEPSGSTPRAPRQEFMPEAPAVPADPASLAKATVAAEQAQLAALATACLQGDTRAWELLVRSQQRRVYGLCYRFTGSAAQAEDLTQDVFLKVYRNLQSFDASKASFGVWLTALTRNLLVDHYRRSRLERASDSLDETLFGEEDGPTRADRLQDSRPSQERHVAGVELRARVQEALAKVSAELREAVILRDLEDMDYREIAEILRIPQGTVKSRISRGRAELARLLKGMEGQVM